MKRMLYALLAVTILSLGLILIGCDGGKRPSGPPDNTPNQSQEPTEPTEVLSGLVVTSNPTKTDYVEGETFKKAGLTVKAQYKLNGEGEVASEKDVTGAITVPVAALTAGQSKVIIKYTEKGVTVQCDVPITVKERFFGDGGGVLRMKPVWDLSKDDDSADRSINMIDTVPDNNIFMKRLSSTRLYANAKFSAIRVSNNEKYGKFGLTVLSEEGDGFFFYIDAAGNGTSMDGAGLGYVRFSGLKPTGAYTPISTPTGFTSSSYQGGAYTELAVYREGGAFALYCNGTNVVTLRTVNGLSANTNAYVGIASFNIMLTVRNYGITDDEQVLGQYEIVVEDCDYLFAGDSHLSKSFWTNFDKEFEGNSAQNLSGEAMKIDDLTQMAAEFADMFTPQGILLHIGLNDINADKAPAETVTAKLKTLFDTYHAAFPDATLYYISLLPGGGEGWTTAQAVNDYVRELSLTDTKLTYIDAAAGFGNADGAGAAQYYTDSQRLNADGYAVFSREIKKALGIERALGSGFGDTANYATSGGWSVADGVAENKGLREQQLYLTGVDEQADFYAEVKLSVLGNTMADAWPKVGIALKSANKTIFYYIDATNNFANLTGSFVVRYNKQDWKWGDSKLNPTAVKLGTQPYYGQGVFKNMAVLKSGNTLYLIADGDIVMEVNGSELFEDGETFCVSVMCFNLNVQVKDAVTITESAEIAAKLQELQK